jgi:hypothetical protein
VPKRATKKSPVSENEDFVRLMEVIRVDPQVRARIAPLLRLDSFQRKSILSTWLQQLQLQKASAAFVGALACLLDDGIANKALEIIRE